MVIIIVDNGLTQAIDQFELGACSQAERDAFEAYDKAHGVRRALVAKLQVRPRPPPYIIIIIIIIIIIVGNGLTRSDRSIELGLQVRPPLHYYYYGYRPHHSGN